MLPDTKDRNRAKKVLVEIIRQSGGALRKRTHLYKAFYLSNLYYFSNTQRVLSDWPIVPMPRGPGIDDGPSLTAELVRDGIIHIGHAPVGPYVEEVFTLMGEERTDLDEDQVAAIKEAVAFIAGKSATELSNLLHEYSRSWKATEDGQQLNIYLDLIPDDEYERLTQQHAEVAGTLAEVFAGGS